MIDTCNAAVLVEGLEKAYVSAGNRTPVLKGVDFVVRRGECVYLAGPSGSGKTTLLSIIGCILSADHGHVRILEQDVFFVNSKRKNTPKAKSPGLCVPTFPPDPRFEHGRERVCAANAARNLPRGS